MEFWNAIAGFTRQFNAQLLFGLSILSIVLLLIALTLISKVRRLGKMAFGTGDGEAARALQQDLRNCARDLSDVTRRLEELQQRHTELKARQELCVQRVGFLRFDAFEDVGGEQSFALALLDANNNGVVVSNLFSRVDSRVYAKRITAGQSDHNLSEEERKAVSKAAPL